VYGAGRGSFVIRGGGTFAAASRGSVVPQRVANGTVTLDYELE